VSTIENYLIQELVDGDVFLPWNRIEPSGTKLIWAFRFPKRLPQLDPIMLFMKDENISVTVQINIYKIHNVDFKY